MLPGQFVDKNVLNMLTTKNNVFLFTRETFKVTQMRVPKFCLNKPIYLFIF